MNLLTWLKDFFLKRLWQEPERGLGLRLLVSALRVLTLASRGLICNQSLVRASSLAYATILGLIPLMALLLALMQALGLPRLLATSFLEHLAPGSRDFALQILKYIQGLRVTSLGVFGAVVLLADLVIVMTNVERAFNATWQVTRGRPWRRKVSDYLSIFLLFPILMAVAFTVSTTFLDHPEIRHFLSLFMPAAFFSATRRLVSLGVLWLAFVFLYLVMPNARVHFSSALVGGVVGCLIWQVAQWIFIALQGAPTYYNAIYGALYNLLFLFLWIFYSWLILLFGTEVAFAYQNLERLTREFRAAPLAAEPVDEHLGLAALVAIAARFYHHLPPLSLPDLARLFDYPEGQAARVAGVLKDCGLVVQVAPEETDSVPRYLPGQPLDQLSVQEVLERLRQTRGAAVAGTLAGEPRLAALIRNLVEAPAQGPALNLQELVELAEDQAPAVPT